MIESPPVLVCFFLMDSDKTSRPDAIGTLNHQHRSLLRNPHTPRSLAFSVVARWMVVRRDDAKREQEFLAFGRDDVSDKRLGCVHHTIVWATGPGGGGEGETGDNNRSRKEVRQRGGERRPYADDRRFEASSVGGFWVVCVCVGQRDVYCVSWPVDVVRRSRVVEQKRRVRLVISMSGSGSEEGSPGPSFNGTPVKRKFYREGGGYTSGISLMTALYPSHLHSRSSSPSISPLPSLAPSPYSRCPAHGYGRVIPIQPPGGSPCSGSSHLGNVIGMQNT